MHRLLRRCRPRRAASLSSRSSAPTAPRSRSAAPDARALPASQVREVFPAGVAFKDLMPDASWLTTKLSGLGMARPTRVQAAAIPLLAAQTARGDDGGDLVMQDVTGSGKTAAYLLPLLRRVSPYEDETQAVVVVPTRELTVQVTAALRELARGGSKRRRASPLRVRRAVGEATPEMGRGMRAAAAPHVVVGTPATLAALAGSGALRLGALRDLVLDEVDHLFHNNSRAAVERLLAARREQAPGARLVFVSATITPEAREAAAAHMRRPRELSMSALDGEASARAGPAWLPRGLRHVTVRADEGVLTAAPRGDSYERHERDELERAAEAEERGEPFRPRPHPQDRARARQLTRLHAAVRPRRTLVFLAEGRLVRPAAEALRARGFRAEALLSDQDKRERSAVLRRASRGCDFLLTTDMLARGMDLPGFTHVVSLGVPADARAYLHRAGRVGRVRREMPGEEEEEEQKGQQEEVAAAGAEAEDGQLPRANVVITVVGAGEEERMASVVSDLGVEADAGTLERGRLRLSAAV